MPIRTVSSTAFALALLSALVAGEARGGPTAQPVLDPLRSPAPELRLEIPVDHRAPGDKLVGRLRSATRSGDEPIDVIVTLHGPGGSRPDRTVVAALAHRFVGWARDLGFEPGRALALQPVVTGRVPSGALLDLAALDVVRTVEVDVRLVGQRAEGRAIVRSEELVAMVPGANAEGIRVAVLDTGIDWTHPELDTRVVSQGDYTGTTGTGFDDHGHGTRVAGIIAGESGGVATRAGLHAMKVLDADNVGMSSWLLGGLDAALAMAADVDVVNMSLGLDFPFAGPCDADFPALAAAVDALRAAGIALFAATGNEGCADGVSLPACLAGVAGVGATYDAILGTRGPYEASCVLGGTCTDLATFADTPTCYTDSGPELDFWAPSDCVTTTKEDGGYVTCFGGTSAATAYTSGVAAQLLGAVPGSTADALLAALAASPTTITDPRNGLVRPRVDAVAAFEALVGGGPAACVPGPTVLCVDDEPGDARFAVRVSYESVLGGGVAGDGQAVPLAEVEVDRGGLFWFFTADNPELLVKILDGCGTNGHHWVFWSAGTTVGFVLTVTDTRTGEEVVYSNTDLNPAAPVTDTEAFVCAEP